MISGKESPFQRERRPCERSPLLVSSGNFVPCRFMRLSHAQNDAEDIGYEPKGPHENAEFAEIAFCLHATFPIGENGPQGVYRHEKECGGSGNAV